MLEDALANLDEGNDGGAATDAEDEGETKDEHLPSSEVGDNTALGGTTTTAIPIFPKESEGVSAWRPFMD